MVLCKCIFKSQNNHQKTCLSPTPASLRTASLLCGPSEPSLEGPAYTAYTLPPPSPPCRPLPYILSRMFLSTSPTVPGSPAQWSLVLVSSVITVDHFIMDHNGVAAPGCHASCFFSHTSGSSSIHLSTSESGSRPPSSPLYSASDMLTIP